MPAFRVMREKIDWAVACVWRHVILGVALCSENAPSREYGFGVVVTPSLLRARRFALMAWRPQTHDNDI